LAASIEVAFIRLAGDGDLGIFVVLLVLLFVRGVAGRSCSSSGDENGDDELYKRIFHLDQPGIGVDFGDTRILLLCYPLPASC